MTQSSFEQFKVSYDQTHRAYWSGALSTRDLADWYQQRLRVVVGHAKSRSRFYSKHLESVDSDSLTLADLSQLPFTTKEHLREEMFNILSGTVNEAIFYYETTGTTGPATPCPRDKKESYASNSQLAVAWQRVITKHFGGSQAPVVGIMGPTEVHSFGDTLGDVCYRLNVCNAKIWPHSPVIGFPKTLQLIRDLKIGVLASSPGLVLGLAKAAEKSGVDLSKDSAVKAFMMSGELCTPALKRNIYSLWGAEAYNSLYGSQEALVIAACNEDDQLVPHRLNYIFEVLDPNTGRSMGDRGHGELCVTMLIDGVKPLIRYRTGDLVTIEETSGSHLHEELTMKVVGRVKDQITLNDRSFTAGQIEQSLMDGIELCLGYQLVITRTKGRDSIVAKLEMSRRAGGDHRKLLEQTRERLHDALGVEAAVLVVDDLSEHVNLGGWFSWKEARIVDQREPATKKLVTAGV